MRQECRQRGIEIAGSAGLPWKSTKVGRWLYPRLSCAAGRVTFPSGEKNKTRASTA